MNVVIFARGYNIQGQIEYCKEYSEKKGYTVAGVIVGQGRELTEVISGLGMNIGRVIVRGMSRISRNMIESCTIQTDLENICGVLVEDATGNPHDDSEQRFIKNLIAAIRENDTRERIKMSLLEDEI